MMQNWGFIKYNLQAYNYIQLVMVEQKKHKRFKSKNQLHRCQLTTKGVEALEHADRLRIETVQVHRH